MCGIYGLIVYWDVLLAIHMIINNKFVINGNSIEKIFLAFEN